MENKQSIIGKEIRLDLIFQTIWSKRKQYLLPLFLTGLISSGLALSMPRYYTVEVKLAPEYSSPASGLSGSLGGMASMLGLNMSSLTSNDAITPNFYPDLMESTNFLVPLMDVHLWTKDNDFRGTYKDYLTQHQQFAWWDRAIGALKNMLKKPEGKGSGQTGVDPFRLSKTEMEIVQAISGSINCSVDKKTDIITIRTTAQDPLVAALLADTVKEKLQEFITEYRTSKSRNDLKHVMALSENALKKYRKAQAAYVSYVDSHQELVLQAYKTEEEALENEMQLAYNAYSSLQQQKQLAQAKVQERTPAFTTIQNATVPVKHAGPKRVIFVLSMTMLAFLVTTIVLLRRRSSGSGGEEDGGAVSASIPEKHIQPSPTEQ